LAKALLRAVLDQDGHILSDRSAVERVVLAMDDLIDAASLDLRESLGKSLNDFSDRIVFRR
jgi:hypothetical protein